MMFKVGDRVKCIDAEGINSAKDPKYVMEGGIYTVSYSSGGRVDLVDMLGGGYYESRFELVKPEPKPQWEVGRWYPAPKEEVVILAGTKYETLSYHGISTFSGTVNFDVTIYPNTIIGIKIISYPPPPKKKVKKIVERWGVINAYGNFVSNYTYASFNEAKHNWDSKKNIIFKLIGEYVIGEYEVEVEEEEEERHSDGSY